MNKIQQKGRTLLDWIRTRRAPRAAALLYHRVEQDVDDPFGLCVSPANFDSQMEALRRRGSVAPLNHHARPGTVSVSFDDGYLDVLENALPVLEKYEIPATIFVTTGSLGRAFWWDRLSALPGITRADYETFRSLTADIRESKLRELETEHPEIEPPHSRAMTLEELRTLAAHPLVTIGAHTVSHARLSSLTKDEQLREIKQSKETLEQATGRPITDFSYPFGLAGRDFDATTVEATRTAGFDAAWAADTGVVTEKSKPFALPRLWIHNVTSQVFENRLNRWLSL